MAPPPHTQWAVRLGTFLVVRVNKVGHDSRLQPYLHKPGTIMWYSCAYV